MNANAIPLDEEALCDLVEKYPHLWEQKNAMYRDKTAKENAWQSIAAIMETNVKECQELWEYLRAKYIRERNKRKNIPSGSAAQTNTWSLYDRLGFLDRGIQTRRTKTNINKKSFTTGSTNLWENMVVDHDGLLSPAGSSEMEKTDSEEEILNDTVHEVMSDNSNTQEFATDNPKALFTHSTSLLSNKENIEKLTVEKNLKKKKTDEPLEKLVNTCTTIGQHINSILSQNNTITDQEDYHYMMSMMEALKKIPKPTEKLRLKASFLVQIADVIEKYQ